MSSSDEIEVALWVVGTFVVLMTGVVGWFLRHSARLAAVTGASE